MIHDHELTFAMAQSAAAGDATNKIDLGQAAPTPGMSKHLTVAVSVNEDLTGTLKVELKTSDTESGTYVTVAEGSFPADAEEGAILQFPVPYRTKRWLKLTYSGATAGKVNAFLTWGRQQWEAAAQAPSVQAALEDI